MWCVLCVALLCSVSWRCAFVLFDLSGLCGCVKATADLPRLTLRLTLPYCYPAGTKEEVECSGQGMCDEYLGQCTCFEGFGSSNGTIDNPGER
jgi:hypothetical protein